MEAQAKHTYNATADDQLSFPRGAILKVLYTMEEDHDWPKAELDGKEGKIPVCFIDIDIRPWFMLKSRAEAETELLKKNSRNEFIQPDGAFLVRPSGSTAGDFSFSVKFGDIVQHLDVLRDSAMKYSLLIHKFDSIDQLVDYHRTASISRTQIIYLKNMRPVQVIANYDFRPQDRFELELHRGDIVTVTDKTDCHWWEGEVVRNTKTLRGLFPATYVSIY